MACHIGLGIIACKVCGSKFKRYNLLKHLQTKHKYPKKEAKDERLRHLTGVVVWKRCWKCKAYRSLDMFKEGDETCNKCLDRNNRLAEKNRARENKKRDERRGEKK